ncbi:hypothetical protein LDENG_00257970 [Lucifuga dentata]|nr:hypothetical protein LDENG_00257970 [Lucifuga dentata]
MVKCAVSACPNRAESVNRGIHRPAKRFFSFPKEPVRVKVWLAALRETDDHDTTEPHFICEDHFLPDDITADGVSSDAIPIMPPYLDGSLGVISPWSAESSDEEDKVDDDAADEDAGGDDAAPPDAPPAAAPVQPAAGNSAQQRSGGGSEDQSDVDIIRVNLHSQIPCRADVALAKLTRRFLDLLVAAPDGSLDLLATSLQTRKRRVYDITNVLGGISLIQKESPNRIKWIGRSPISSFLRRNHARSQKELQKLQLVEETLDSLIKSCAQQLFDMTDNTENTAYPFTAQQGQRSPVTCRMEFVFSAQQHHK